MKIKITRRTFVAGILSEPGVVVDVDEKQAGNLLSSGKGEKWIEPARPAKAKKESDDA